MTAQTAQYQSEPWVVMAMSAVLSFWVLPLKVLVEFQEAKGELS